MWWGCNSLSYFSWPGGMFSFVIWGLLVLTLLYLGARILSSLTSCQSRPSRDGEDSLEILKLRYARGELTQEDYAKMRHTLVQS
jgi:putative membrane protein